MEKLLNQILNEIQGIRSDIVGIKTELSSVKTELSSVKTELSAVKSDVDLIKQELVGVNHRLDKVEDVQADIKSEVQEMNHKTTIIFNQTANLSEFTTFTTASLTRIGEEINAVEKVTAKNCFDITHLKSIK